MIDNIDIKPIKIIYEDGFKVEGDGYDVKVTRPLTPSEAQQIIYDTFGSNDIAALNCSDMSDEEFNRIVDEFNSIGCTSFNHLSLTEEEIIAITKQENT